METAIVDLYCRVSTQEQVDGYSLGEQEDRLRKYAAAHGWIIKSCVIDAGVSGGSLQRDGIRQVIEDAEKHRINKVVVYKLDRLSRSQKDTMFLIEDVFLKNGVDFCSMTETLDTSTALGMAMIGILSTFAQFERAQIKERMMLGRDALVKTGRFHGNGHEIIGYNYDVQTKTLTQNEYDAMMVRKVYELFNSGKSIAFIYKYLNDQKWREHHWTSHKVERILTQPMYVGRQRWKGETYQVENCPCILDYETWDQAQKEMSRRSSKNIRPKSAYDHVTLLGGLCWCGVCGKRMFASKPRHDSLNYRYYCQTTKARKMHWHDVKPCGNTSFSAAELNELIIAETSKLSLKFSAGEDLNANGENIYTAELNAIENRLKALEQQQKRLVDLYALGSIEPDMIQTKAEEIRRERTALENKIEEIKNPNGRLNTVEIKQAFETFADIIANISKENGYMELYNVVRLLIESITLNADSVEIHWNFD